MSTRLNALFVMGPLILLLGTVGCSTHPRATYYDKNDCYDGCRTKSRGSVYRGLRLKSITIGDAQDASHERVPRNFTVHDLGTGKIKHYRQIDPHTVHDLTTGEIKQFHRINSHTIHDLSTRDIKHSH